MRDEATKIAGTLSIWLSSIFVVFMLPLGIINLFLPDPVPIPLDLVASYLLGTLATFITYVYGRTEAVLDRQERLLQQPVHGIQVFKTTREFLDKLIEITVGASAVSTLNLSPPRGEDPGLDRYFNEVHTYLKNRHSRLHSFRSIASVDTLRKSVWLVERSVRLLDTRRVSFAIFDQHQTRPFLHPLSVHITQKDNQYYVFMFPPVDLTGWMDSILISDPTLARVIQSYFDTLWRDSLKINEGGQVRREGLDRLQELNPQITADPNYQTLRRLSES